MLTSTCLISSISKTTSSRIDSFSGASRLAVLVVQVEL